MSEIRTTVYSKELQKQLFPDNSFFKKSIGETGVAINAIAVEKPQQGTIPKAKNGEPDSYPLKVTKADDSKSTYPVELVYAPPILITSESEMLTNYSKRQTKQEQQAGVINTRCADIAAHNWGPTKSTNIIKSTGEGRATNVAGLTGNRKAITKADILKVYNLLLRMNVSGLPGKWYALLTADAYSDLLNIDDFVSYEKTGYTTKLEQGILGRIMNIEIMTRSTERMDIGLLYSNASTPVKRAMDEIVNSDRPANLFWHEKMVCRAEGTVKTSINTDRADYVGGTLISSYTRFGAAIVREDEKGVVALLEDNA
ncbi:hypothetical protein ACT29H_01705 [Thermophagus sp. OGC60D27]|uniref:hypothetical protein n=1 Tax=Thermophagus sp. OGC60D27 TaxID=3458415 RepID=UPI00403848AE